MEGGRTQLEDQGTVVRMWEPGEVNSLSLIVPGLQHIHHSGLTFLHFIFDLAAGLSVPSGAGHRGGGESADILICMQG